MPHHRGRDARIDAEPQQLLHHEIGVGERPDLPVFDVGVGRLPEQISGEQKARGYLLLLEVTDEFMPGERRVGAHGDGKAKPTRIRSGRSFGQDQEIAKRGQPFPQLREVLFALRDEAGQLFHLCQADGGLHVGELQIVADVRIGVFVVVAAGQVAHGV